MLVTQTLNKKQTTLKNQKQIPTSKSMSNDHILIVIILMC